MSRMPRLQFDERDQWPGSDEVPNGPLVDPHYTPYNPDEGPGRLPTWRERASQMDAPFYYNKLAGPMAEYSTTGMESLAPPVAQRPQEQAILDAIARANIERAVHLARTGAAGALTGAVGVGGMMPGMGSVPSRLLHVLGLGGMGAGLTADGWAAQNSQDVRRRGLESELEAYATSDRR